MHFLERISGREYFASDRWLTDICAIDETEKVEQRDGGDDVQINLQTQATLRDRVVLHQGLAILVCGGLASLGGVVEGGIVQRLDVVVVVDVLCLGFHHVGGCTVADLQTLPRMLGVEMRGSRGGICKGIRRP